jgi:excisionase family DNA binding protein
MQSNQPAPAGSTAIGLPLSQSKLMYGKVEAAAMLSISVRTLDYLIANKKLPVRRIGKRVLISYQALVLFSKQDHQTGRVQ